MPKSGTVSRYREQRDIWRRLMQGTRLRLRSSESAEMKSKEREEKAK